MLPGGTLTGLGGWSLFLLGVVGHVHGAPAGAVNHTRLAALTSLASHAVPRCRRSIGPEGRVARDSTATSGGGFRALPTRSFDRNGYRAEASEAPLDFPGGRRMTRGPFPLAALAARHVALRQELSSTLA